MNVPELIKALGQLAWPILTAVVLWQLLPIIREIASSRGFSIKFGDMEVSVQEASDQLRGQVEDLQEKVTILRRQLPETPVLTERQMAKSIVEPPKAIRRILWVDDKPSNNAYEIAKLSDEGIQIVQAKSTSEGIGILSSGRSSIDLVISDMGRYEGGRFEHQAAIELIKMLRQADLNIPVLVFGSARDLEQNRRDVLNAGGNGMTASPVELFEMIERAGQYPT